MAIEALAQSEVPAFTMNFATSSTPAALASQTRGGMPYFFVPAGASPASASPSFVATPNATLCLQSKAGSVWGKIASGASVVMKNYLMRASEFESTFFCIPQGKAMLYVGLVWNCNGTCGIHKEINELQSPQDWLARNDFYALTTRSEFMDAIQLCYASEGRDCILYSFAYGDSGSDGSIDCCSAKDQESKGNERGNLGVTQSIPLNVSYSDCNAGLSALKG